MLMLNIHISVQCALIPIHNQQWHLWLSVNTYKMMISHGLKMSQRNTSNPKLIETQFSNEAYFT